MEQMNRRQFVASLATVPFLSKVAHAAPIPIIDTHIHLFDRSRLDGIEWPFLNDRGPLGSWHSALSPQFQTLVKPLGIVGAIIVESSSRSQDNQWMLDQASNDPFMVGVVGALRAGHPAFAKDLEHFQKNRLFKGIRYRTWGPTPGEGPRLGDMLQQPHFVADMKLLADAGMTFEAIPAHASPEAWVRLTDLVPSLRILIPHLASPMAQVPKEPAARDSYMAAMKEIGQRPQIAMKISGIVRRVDGKVVTDLNFYKDSLDQLWGLLGENRVIFGTDWPNSENSAPLADIMAVTTAYVNSKGSTAAEKVYWKNSVKWYRWTPRASNQPRA